MGRYRLLSATLTLFDLAKIVVLVMAFIAAVFALLGVPLIVSGSSMEPNFHNKQLVLVEKITYLKQEPRRGDVVAARFPADPAKTRLIKRVIGIPGDKVEALNGQLTLNGVLLDELYNPIHGAPPYQEISSTTLKDNQYFLSGDNRPGSSDSRLWGPVSKEDILGRVSFVLWPIQQISYVVRSEAQ